MIRDTIKILLRKVKTWISDTIMKQEIKYITKLFFPHRPLNEEICDIKTYEKLLNRITFGWVEINFRKICEDENHVIVNIAEIEFGDKIITVLAIYRKIAIDLAILEKIRFLEEKTF
jgi:hypothetical protein